MEKSNRAEENKRGIYSCDNAESKGFRPVKAFIDTSTLFKRYIEEEGSTRLNTLLENVLEIIIAPTTLCELHSVLERRLREKTLLPADARWIEKEFLYDYNFFGVVTWNDVLQKECIRVIRKYQLKVLDGMQLAGALIARTDLFVTSDKRLFDAAKKEVARAIFL